MSKVTEWFPGDIAPMREGVYEVRSKVGGIKTYFAYWDGRAFGFRTEDVLTALEYCRCYEYRQAPERIEWRGLATRPSKRGKR